MFAGSSLKGQSMIDLTKEEVRVMVKEKHMEFRRDKSVVNQRFNYLKYVNGLRTRTWIIYFTDEDICRSSKLVCEYGEYDEVLEDLNEAHEKVGESEWSYDLNGDSIQVILARQEWYFTVREARKK
ncbi:MAG: hypothetical protein DRI98_01860 [Bacteroidetes bacterium]|nr:MAG: hypothetical protein DRI98_01860 [Bacteroidota bacterium]